MKGDFSRDLFDPARRYRSVRMQQGRVQLDADWNEQADIVSYRAETETADVVGACGGPLHEAGFGLSQDLAAIPASEKARLDRLFPPAFALAGGDFLIAPGRYYVDGILVENDHFVPFTKQPDAPGLPALTVSQKGTHVVYLDVWERHVTALDDPRLRETALGGPDTTTRGRTVWQVRTVFEGEGTFNCATPPPKYLAETAEGTGTLRARAKREAASSDPCIVPESADYRGLENQLYRVEIHAPGSPFDLPAGAGHTAIVEFPTVPQGTPTQVKYTGGSWNVGDAVEVYPSAANSDPMAGHLAYVTAHNTAQKTLTLNVVLPPISMDTQPRLRKVAATYKWSRDDGSVVSLVRTIAGADVVVHSLGADELLAFRRGDWVELVDDSRELAGLPGHLSQVADVIPATRTVRLSSPPTPFPGNVPTEDPTRHLKLRRWDGVGAAKVRAAAPSEGYADLEDGVQVRFEEGTFKTGDYWLIPARTATADARSGRVEWPADEADATKPAALRPRGIVHRYCRIGLIRSNGTTLTLTDCRTLFPPTTELATLVYVGGDGQETLPGGTLSQPLEVGVFRGRWPVAGARVQVKADPGGNLVDLDNAANTGNSVKLTTAGTGLARCSWTPAADTARPSQQARAQLLDAADAPLPPVVDFNATLSLAERVAYTPDPTCTDLAGADTVKKALDLLCARKGGDGCSITVRPGEQLDEVIEAQVEAGIRDICLCLAPGEHKLSNLIRLQVQELALRISGCGAATRLILTERFEITGASEVALRTMDLLVATEAGISLRDCAEVDVQGCGFRRIAGGTDLLEIGGAQRIEIIDNFFDAQNATSQFSFGPIPDLLRFGRRESAARAHAVAREIVENDSLRDSLAEELDSRMEEVGQLTEPERRAYGLLLEALTTEPAVESLAGALLAVVDASARAVAGPALTILDGNAETVIADNEIMGWLTLYGPAFESGAGFPLGVLQAIRRLQVQNRLTLVPGAGTLHLRDNRLARIGLDEETTGQLRDAASQNVPLRISRLFRAIHLTDNTLALSASTFLAPHAVLTSNHFDQRQQDVGAVIAGSAIYTGNFAPDDVRLFHLANRRADAANLVLNIVSL